MSAKLAQLLQLRAAEASAKEAHAHAQKLLRRAKQREGRRKSFGAKLERVDAVAVVLYVLNGHDSECAVLWLEKSQQHKRNEEEDPALLQRRLLEKFLLCDEDALAAAARHTTAPANSIVGQAHAFFRDWRAAQWVQTQNTTNMAAPSTKALAARTLGVGGVAGAAGGIPPVLGRALPGKARMWAVRWRRRVGARLRKPKLADVVPAASLREKAGGFFWPGGRKKVVRGAQKAAANCGRFRTQNGCRVDTRSSTS